MCTNWKRFTFGAIMLASLTLFLFGCGSGGGSPQAPATKRISGVVSDPATGLPLANASVTAYAIGANGVVATTPLSIPATGMSGGQGNYDLNIPASYSGGVMVVATLPDGSQIRSAIPSVTAGQASPPPTMVSLATDMVVQYIIRNNGGSFTPANIQAAILVLEPFFGPNFTEIPPPAVGTVPTPLQQNLIVVTEAINSMVTTGGFTIPGLVTVTGGNIALGQGTTFTALNTAIGTVATDLITSGVIPNTFTPPVITPIPVPPPITDTTPPAAPANLAATSTFSTVTLTWDAALAADGVTSYLVYRDGALITSLTAPATTFTDTGLVADTTYTYELRARDAAGNVSPASTPVSIRTAIIPTFTISGTVTFNGGKPDTGVVVPITITGAGAGIAFTDADGNYSFTGARAGTYTVTPSLQGFLFTPVSQTVTVTNANVTGVNFATVTPPGTVIGGVVYPDGIVIGGVTYPPGTIIGGVSYPSGIVIGGVTYPTATVIGGVTYPTGTVIGGTTYPNGVVIGGVTYPPGTVVGGIAFPPGAVTTGITAPSGIIIGGVTYPAGTLVSNVTYPTGVIIGGTTYPSGTVLGGVTAPGGTIIGALTYPNGILIGGVVYPTGSISIGISGQSGSVSGGVTSPAGTAIGTVSYPGSTITVSW